MPFDISKKILFLHIPKTGGSSIITYFYFKTPRIKTYDNFHMTYDQLVKENVLENIDSYFKFAIVRNPWDRAVSEYTCLWEATNQTFEDYIDERLIPNIEQSDTNFEAHYIPQYKIIYSNGKLKVDYLGRFENYINVIKELCERLEVKFDPKKYPHTNKSDRKDYRYYYNDRTKTIISELYRKDIEYFDYKF